MDSRFCGNDKKGNRKSFMAKIIYGVAGEGFGHSSRSQLIGQRLIEAGNDVMFVGSKSSLVYLTEYFGDSVKEIYGLSFAYDDGYVDPLQTVKKNLLTLRAGRKLNAALYKNYFVPFKPDMVISDFEPFSARWAKRNGVPFISIDNEHILTIGKLENKPKTLFTRTNARLVTKYYYTGAACYIIFSFFDVPLRGYSAVLVPPVIRPEVTALKPTQGKHLVLYSTTGQKKNEQVELLNKFADSKFYIYGFNEDSQSGNCVFKKRSTEGFLTDVASGGGVIASAGFSLMSECMYLKKKMLLLPLAGQYEQIVNAYYAEKLGLGISADKLDEDAIKRFNKELAKPYPTDDKIIWPDNKKFFQILQGELNKLNLSCRVNIC